SHNGVDGEVDEHASDHDWMHAQLGRHKHSVKAQERAQRVAASREEHVHQWVEVATVQPFSDEFKALQVGICLCILDNCIVDDCGYGGTAIGHGSQILKCVSHEVTRLPTSFAELKN